MLAFLALHLWQSTLVLIAAWVLTRACRRNAAAVRYWIWLAASVKFLVPFAWLQSLGDHLGRSLPAPPAFDPAWIETGKVIFVPSAPSSIASLLLETQVAVAVMWAAGATMLLLRWLLQWRALHRSLAPAPQLPSDLPVEVRITSGDLPPGVFGVFRPVVILPRHVLRALRPEQLQAVLAHEMHHVRRRDNLLAALHKCVEVLFWFHPLVWWIGANLLREREAACDESVIEEGCERVIYAESLLHVCRLSVTANFPGVAASTGGSLMQRMSSIMSPQRAAPVDHSRLAVLLLAAAATCYGPIAVGIVAGAMREASATGPIAFDAVTLEPSEPAWWSSTQFDADARRLALKNISLRHLISLAYPTSKVNADPELIDRVYHIEARWRALGRTSETKVYRELLQKIVRTNTNLRIYIKDECGRECDHVPRQLVAGRSSSGI